jgi:hypothetical protein
MRTFKGNSGSIGFELTSGTSFSYSQRVEKKLRRGCGNLPAFIQPLIVCFETPNNLAASLLPMRFA